MIRIRTGASWKHDPGLAASLRRATGPARAAAAREVVDALAIEVDGVDIAAGQAEGALLPSLEALLRAIARIVGGEAHAAVPFREGELELVIRRRGASALLTLVSLSRPSRVLARDVEVEVEALAAAALDAGAAFCRELAEILPEEAEREGRRLRAAARALRRAEAGPFPRPRAGGRGRAPRVPQAKGGVTCALDLSDEEGQLLAYEGGRPDLGSLLVAGRLTLRGADGATLAVFPGIPFLALRDLGAGVDRLLAALRRGEARCEIALARPGRGGVTTLRLDLAAARLDGPEASAPCPPLELARAIAEAALELGRVARVRNPRQAENAHLADLEGAAAERLAQIEELAEGDRGSGEPLAAGARVPPLRAPSQRPLGPGRLRRLAFRRLFAIDVGAPAGPGLYVRGGIVLAAGSAAVAALERATGRILWRAPGAAHAAVLPGALLLARGGELEAVAPRTGRRLWARPLPGTPAFTAVAFARGPFLLVGGGALTALDPATGQTLWRLVPPGAGRLAATAFGGIVAAGADTGFVYGVDGTGRVVWRVRGPGPVLRSPAPVAGLALVLSAADSGAGSVALALDPAGGARLWEAALDLVPSGPPIAWGRRIVVAGALAGDPIVATLDERGAPAWTVVPPLSGSPTIGAAGALLVARDPAGGLVALGRDGASRWTRPASAGAPAPGAVPPAIARGTVIVAADGVTALDARTGEIVGAIPGVAPVRLAVDASLGLALLDADGLATGYRVATHLSVVA